MIKGLEHRRDCCNLWWILQGSGNIAFLLDHIQFQLGRQHNIYRSTMGVLVDIDMIYRQHSKLFWFLFDQLGINIVLLKGWIVLELHMGLCIHISLKLGCKCGQMGMKRIFLKRHPRIMGRCIECSSFRKCWILMDNIAWVDKLTMMGLG